MKLIIQNNRISATATAEYQATGREQAVISAPPDFDPQRLERYSYAGGVLTDVPQQVTRRQALQALTIRGHIDAVRATIEAIEDPVQRELARIELDDSQEFERYRPLVVQIGAVLGLDLDDLFRFASTL